MQEATVAEQSSKIFTDVREVEITRAIANEFHDVLIDRAESDVIIIGAGPVTTHKVLGAAHKQAHPQNVIIRITET